MDRKKIVCELKRGNEVCQEWHIKDWRNNQQIFKRLARCPVEIDFGDNSKEKTIMTFFLKDDTSAPSQGLHLCVSVNHGKAPMAFVVNTVTLDGNGVGMDIGGGDNHITVFMDSDDDFKSKIVKEHFLRWNVYARFFLGPPPNSYSRYHDLRIVFRVTPLLVHEKVEPDESKPSLCSLTQNLGVMFNSEENMADLTLEMKDGLLLSAHKFILCARSPVLKILILQEMKKKEFAGVIQISNVNSKPMLAILHWMYTDELTDKGSNFDGEIAEAAKYFGLQNLVECLKRN